MHSWIQMLQQLPQASHSLKNLLEEEWNFTKVITPYIRGGEAQSGKLFWSVTCLQSIRHHKQSHVVSSVCEWGVWILSPFIYTEIDLGTDLLKALCEHEKLLQQAEQSMLPKTEPILLYSLWIILLCAVTSLGCCLNPLESSLMPACKRAVMNSGKLQMTAPPQMRSGKGIIWILDFCFSQSYCVCSRGGALNFDYFWFLKAVSYRD